MKNEKTKVIFKIEKLIEQFEEFITRWENLYSIIINANNNGYSAAREKEFQENKSWLMEHYTFGDKLYAKRSPDIIGTCLANAQTLRYFFHGPTDFLIERFEQLHNMALLSLKGYYGKLKEKREELIDVPEEEFGKRDEPINFSLFMGHSFAEEDRNIIELIMRSLSVLSVKLITGEKPSADSISEKVKERIHKSPCVIIVLTRREKLKSGEYDTSGWLIQEAAYSLAKEKRLILMVEEGVKNYGGIQGDLEEIRFNREDISDALLKLQEMILDEIKKSRR
jgi:hypothetical protein